MTSFGPQIIAALVLGVVLVLGAALGLLARQSGHTEDTPTALGETLATIGSSYISLLRSAVIPLVFFAVLASIANLSQVANAARLAWKTLLWFAITAFVSVVIGIALGLVFRPGAGAGDRGQARGHPRRGALQRAAQRQPVRRRVRHRLR